MARTRATRGWRTKAGWFLHRARHPDPNPGPGRRDPSLSRRRASRDLPARRGRGSPFRSSSGCSWPVSPSPCWLRVASSRGVARPSPVLGRCIPRWIPRALEPLGLQGCLNPGGPFRTKWLSGIRLAEPKRTARRGRESAQTAPLRAPSGKLPVRRRSGEDSSLGRRREGRASRAVPLLPECDTIRDRRAAFRAAPDLPETGRFHGSTESW